MFLFHLQGACEARKCCVSWWTEEQPLLPWEPSQTPFCLSCLLEVPQQQGQGQVLGRNLTRPLVYGVFQTQTCGYRSTGHFACRLLLCKTTPLFSTVILYEAVRLELCSFFFVEMQVTLLSSPCGHIGDHTGTWERTRQQPVPSEERKSIAFAFPATKIKR